MKVYRVTMAYCDDDHDHGLYESPLFEDLGDAEGFLLALKNTKDFDKKWWSTDGGPEKMAFIEEIEVVEEWDGVLARANDYLIVV
jgi:hypothetical protein